MKAKGGEAEGNVWGVEAEGSKWKGRMSGRKGIMKEGELRGVK